MTERDKDGAEERSADKAPKTGQDVGPPDERVDDEAGSEAKTTRRQE